MQTSYGSMRVYEWGNENGRKVMMVHGDATCAPVWKRVADKLVAAGCRVIVLGRSLIFYSPFDFPAMAVARLHTAT